MYNKHGESGYNSALEGIEQKTLVHGDKTLMTEFLLKKGSTLPKHAHPHEQTGYLVKGRIRLSIGTETFEAQPGDSWCIPGGVEHGAHIIEDSLAIEVFSPVREDYLPKEKE
ncbi:MAG: cupin domain-containing protein [Thermodesulfobacteriota bacterium]|nr:cupin domain-containing protein [Thermodesulfobacteriota bacterium]